MKANGAHSIKYCFLFHRFPIVVISLLISPGKCRRQRKANARSAFGHRMDGFREGVKPLRCNLGLPDSCPAFSYGQRNNMAGGRTSHIRRRAILLQLKREALQVLPPVAELCQAFNDKVRPHQIDGGRQGSRKDKCTHLVDQIIMHRSGADHISADRGNALPNVPHRKSISPMHPLLFGTTQPVFSSHPRQHALRPHKARHGHTVVSASPTD